jgi:hypothetical protein
MGEILLTPLARRGDPYNLHKYLICIILRYSRPKYRILCTFIRERQRVFNIRYLLPRLCGRSPTCSTFTAGQLRLDVAGYRSGGKHHQENRKRWHQSGGGQSDRSRPPFVKVGAAMLAVSWWAVLKDTVGYETIKLDDDPLKAKIKMVGHLIAVLN